MSVMSLTLCAQAKTFHYSNCHWAEPALAVLGGQHANVMWQGVSGRCECEGVLPGAWNLNAPHLLLMIYCVGLVMFGFVGISYIWDWFILNRNINTVKYIVGREEGRQRRKRGRREGETAVSWEMLLSTYIAPSEQHHPSWEPSSQQVQVGRRLCLASCFSSRTQREVGRGFLYLGFGDRSCGVLE